MADKKNFKNDTVSRSWFCTFNNPEKHGFSDLSPVQTVDEIINIWVKDNQMRVCAVAYCVSVDGTPHLHTIFQDTKPCRFSSIKKLFPSMHIEASKGSKNDMEDYIHKNGKFAEHGEQVLHVKYHGEIKSQQGKRTGVEAIEEMINAGYTPNQIFDTSIIYRKYDKIIREAYYRKRYKETPMKREIMNYWHVGSSGTGKSYTEFFLAEFHGEDNIYKVSEYEKGFMDKYSGQPILFMDEFRGNLSYSQLLSILDVYKSQIHARYTNVYGLWTEVHITSVFPPELVYREMRLSNKAIDTYEQLRRRITYVVYHYKNGEEFCKYQIPMSEYTTYEELKEMATGIPLGFEEVQLTEPF